MLGEYPKRFLEETAEEKEQKIKNTNGDKKKTNKGEKQLQLKWLEESEWMIWWMIEMSLASLSWVFW